MPGTLAVTHREIVTVRFEPSVEVASLSVSVWSGNHYDLDRDGDDVACESTDPIGRTR